MAMPMKAHAVVSHEDWVSARKDLLQKEKEFSRLRDQLSQHRRELPWERVEKQYVFAGPNGNQSLADLFGGRSQLIVYHFMFGPGWEQGCPSCSYLADTFDGCVPHLAARDTAFVVISRAPLSELQAFQKRMQWRFQWLSSFETDFNFDYHVSFPKERSADETVYYNYDQMKFSSEELPGASVFYKDEGGALFHTYSTYARGLDILMPTYNFLDLTAKGRDEDDLPHTMAWVRHHDRYEKPPLTQIGTKA
jgi:predicted dithiol-disulfide oxidoreductase (DUF899 family)